MKSIQFKSNNREWLVVDNNLIDNMIEEWHSSNSNLSLHEYLGLSFKQYREYLKGFVLSDITEEQASNVVDNPRVHWLDLESKKTFGFIHDGKFRYYTSAKECLYSLLKSKGVDITNGNYYLFEKLK